MPNKKTSRYFIQADNGIIYTTTTDVEIDDNDARFRVGAEAALFFALHAYENQSIDFEGEESLNRLEKYVNCIDNRANPSGNDERRKLMLGFKVISHWLTIRMNREAIKAQCVRKFVRRLKNRIRLKKKESKEKSECCIQ